jgi:hypothetical protein
MSQLKLTLRTNQAVQRIDGGTQACASTVHTVGGHDVGHHAPIIKMGAASGSSASNMSSTSRSSLDILAWTDSSKAALLTSFPS